MKKIAIIEREIRRHKDLYCRGNPEISDHEYDKLEKELQIIDPNNSLFASVGSGARTDNRLKHDQKMLSLNKTYRLEDLYRWIGEEDVISMHKIDGASCSLVYRRGELLQGKTRGDGVYGEDISEKAFYILDIEKKIAIEECEVRGEIYCSEKNFFLLSEEMVSLGLERPSSQRNIVAGLLGRKENIELCRYLSFFAFDLISDKIKIKDEWNKLELLQNKLGFKVPRPKHHKDGREIESVVSETESFMGIGDYLVDGVVFSYNDLNLHKRLGSTAHHPRFRMALKFQGESKKTEIIEILWSISRNGHLTPIGKVCPVELSGAKISRVTFHNYGRVKLYELKKGDGIEIIRSGEVIPKLLAKIKSSSGHFEVPKQCPVCGAKVIIQEIHLVCPNKKCLGRIRENILNFIQKIGIEDLSSKRLSAMLAQGLVSDIIDLYRLDQTKLLSLAKVKDKLATKILSEIEKSKKSDLVTFMSALGISGGAYNKCEKVVNAGFNTLEKLKEMSVEDLRQIESFAEKSSKEFTDSLATKWKMVDELVALGMELKAPPIKQGPLAQMRFVITGELSRKRSDVEKEIKRYGGNISTSVSKGTNYLVTNNENSTSSKIKKAKELKIPIISEDELIKMMK